MKRILLIIGLFVFLSMACQAVVPTPTLTPTSTSTLTPMPTATSTITPAPLLGTEFTSADFLVRTHPDGVLYIGDQVSIEIIAPPDLERGYEYSAQIVAPNGEVLEQQKFSPFGIGGRSQATFEWSWDTSGIQDGAHDLKIMIQPGGLTWIYTVILQPASELPALEVGAQWAYEESDCCLIYYITGTAAERDLERLLTSADAQAEDVASFLQTDFSEPIEIVSMSRVIGHGGFASGDINITYMDRNYAGSDFDLVLHHEMVHILDARLGGSLRPSLFVEGLATYLTGGHFKPEPIVPRASALLELMNDDGSSWYLPLEPLADNFYNAQHEIGYLQAAALVEFMVDRYGWEAFTAFYRDIQPATDSKHSTAIDGALQVHFGISFAELEEDFVDMLRAQEVTRDHMDDVRLTILFYDTVRRYQQSLDPSAYFLSAWLPDGVAMRQYGIVADLVRQPSNVENIALETLLVAADKYLDAGHYAESDQALEAVNAVLEAIENQVQRPFDVHPLAIRHYQVVEWLLRVGFQAQSIWIDGDQIVVEALGDNSQITVIELEGEVAGWQLYGD